MGTVCQDWNLMEFLEFREFQARASAPGGVENMCLSDNQCFIHMKLVTK